MGDEAEAIARDVLRTIQATVDARDVTALTALFGDPAVLIGTGGDARTTDTRRQYLTAVATQPESLRWDWREVVPFHEAPGVIGFAAFGEIVVTDDSGERRAPMRLTALAVEENAGWRLRQFHGSIPSDF